MEIKTTNQIERKLMELVLDSKDLDRIEKREDYLKKKWVAVDNLIKYIEEFKDKNAFNKWQIRKVTLIKKLTEVSANSSHS